MRERQKRKEKEGGTGAEGSSVHKTLVSSPTLKRRELAFPHPYIMNNSCEHTLGFVLVSSIRLKYYEAVTTFNSIL